MCVCLRTCVYEVVWYFTVLVESVFGPTCECLLSRNWKLRNEMLRANCDSSHRRGELKRRKCGENDTTVKNKEQRKTPGSASSGMFEQIFKSDTWMRNTAPEVNLRFHPYTANFFFTAAGSEINLDSELSLNILNYPLHLNDSGFNWCIHVSFNMELKEIWHLLMFIK